MMNNSLLPREPVSKDFDFSSSYMERLQKRLIKNALHLRLVATKYEVSQIKRNYDYSGNYLDRIKALQEKRKKKKASKDSQVVLGVDIDDTLTDTSRFFTEALSNPDRQLNEEEKKASRWYDVPDSGVTKEEEEEVFKKFLKDDTFAKLPPDSSAVQVLQALKDKGVKIVLITARPESQLRDATERWLAEHNIPHDDLFFSTNKDQIMEQEGVDFLIDDDLANAFDLEKVIVIDKPWNRDYKGRRISKLEDLLELF